MASPDLDRQVPQPDHRETTPYSERSILVLGGSSGIGLQAVAEFVRLGAANVYLGTSNLENFDKAKLYLQRREQLEVPPTVQPFHADVTDKQQIAKAAAEIHARGQGITDVIFSQAGGMDNFMRQLHDQHLDPLIPYTYRTPIEALSPGDRGVVEQRLAIMRQDLERWTQDALPQAIAVNYQGTFDAIDVLGETFPKGFTGIFYNSTWGDQSGVPGVEIPLLYRPVDVSKAMVRDRLAQEGQTLQAQGIYMGELVASLVKDTKVGKMFKDFFFNLMEPEQRRAIIASSITTSDVVHASRTMLESDPTQWPTYPLVYYVYGQEGVLVIDTKLVPSAMYTMPYKF